MWPLSSLKEIIQKTKEMFYRNTKVTSSKKVTFNK